jgi:hypothetical protein
MGGATGQRENSAAFSSPPAATGCSRATERSSAGWITSATSGAFTTPTRSSSAIVVCSRSGVSSPSVRWRKSGERRRRSCCAAYVPSDRRAAEPSAKSSIAFGRLEPPAPRPRQAHSLASERDPRQPVVFCWKSDSRSAARHALAFRMRRQDPVDLVRACRFLRFVLLSEWAEHVLWASVFFAFVAAAEAATAGDHQGAGSFVLPPAFRAQCQSTVRAFGYPGSVSATSAAGFRSGTTELLPAARRLSSVPAPALPGAAGAHPHPRRYGAPSPRPELCSELRTQCEQRRTPG